MGQNISCRGKKRHRAKFSRHQNRGKVNMLRNQVYISDDTWLETIKFLTFPQWSQKAFVCRQINRIVERNISHLPKLVLDDATMYFAEDNPKEIKKSKVPFHTTQRHKTKQWLKDRIDFTFRAPSDVTAENVLIGAGIWNCDKYKTFYQWAREFTTYLNLRINALEEIPRFKIQKIFSTTTPILYREQFNPVTIQHSWTHLAQFLELVYHPTSYFREVEMFAVNQKFIDFLACNVDTVGNKPCYIRCAFFTLHTGEDTNTANLSDSLDWLVRNVRAKHVWICDIDDTAMFPVLANFLFGTSGANQCASKEIYFMLPFVDRVEFLNFLIEKFHTIPTIENAVPTIGLLYTRDDEIPANLGPNLIDEEDDLEGAEALYMILNGQNLMWIALSGSIHEDYYDCKIGIYPI